MSKGKWGVNNKGRGEITQSSQSKGKETISVELSGETPPKTKKSDANNQEFKFSPKQYSFKDEQWLQYSICSKRVIS